MKLHSSELPLVKPQPRRKTSKLAPLVALIVFLTIPLYYPSIKESSKKLYESSIAYESLEDTIRPTSLLESSKGENSNNPCSNGSPQCNEGEGQSGGDMPTHHHEPVDSEMEHGSDAVAHLNEPVEPVDARAKHGGDIAADHHEPVDAEIEHLHESMEPVDAGAKHGGDIAADHHEPVDDEMEHLHEPVEPVDAGAKHSGDIAADRHEPVDAGERHENTNKPCSGDSSSCNEDKSGGAMAARHDEAVATRKKPGKGRRKRPRRPKTHHPTIELEDSSKQEIEKEPTSTSNDPTSTSNDRGAIRSELLDDGQCDLFSGEWVPNPEGPYYTNDTCNAIQEHQNCLKFERPDREFLKWRWKPDDCELPVFDPNRFLELVRGKSIAFVGDSVARNHMQSLICLLSRVAQPEDLSGPLDQNKRYEYREHNFNISMFWSPYLVKTEKTDPNDEKRPFKLYLDEFDEHWTSNLAPFDYVVISAGHWFFRPTYFYLNHRLTACLYCSEPNVNHLTSFFSYRRAFRTAFRAVNAAVNFNGVVFLRTFAPSHFEGAAWDQGGDCPRTRPYRRNETDLEDYSREMYVIQLEELRIAQREGRRTGGKIRLFDATKAMLLRPDGHPSKYGHPAGANRSFPNDCVHWCLPGPIDSWNDFLQELLKREIGDSNI